ncbi:MAG: RNA polymerase sigma factor RpoD/SigA [Brevinematales bacterium]
MKEHHILKQYLKEIARYPLLSPEDETELARRIQQGDMNAKKTLIESNLRLVVKIAIEMNRGKMSLMDIIQNGNLGLIRAAEKFDPERNIRFSSYAAYWIKQSILRHFQKDENLEKISARIQNKKRNTRRFIESFFVSQGHLPSASELAREMSLSIFEAAQELKNYQPHLYEGPDSSLENIADPENIENTICNQLLAEEIENILSEFDNDSQKLLRLRYGFENEEGATLSELSQQFHITIEGIRQRENRLLTTLRNKHPSLKYYLA